MSTHVYYHLGKIQRRLQRKSLAQRIYRKLFPNRTAFIVTVTFFVVCFWLALGAPMP